MNRETLIAVFLGFAGGILIALLLITLPKKINFDLNQRSSSSPTPTSQQAKQEESKPVISIESPQNESLIEGKETTIKGKTKENSLMVISGPSEDQVIQSDKNGNFSAPVKVYEGENFINLTVYLPDDQTASYQLTVFATSENL